MREEIKKELVEHILPFWEGMKDEEFGGYYGYMDCDLQLNKQGEKGCILNSRILWTFSNAYLVLKDTSYLPYAAHAFRFLKEHFYDKENGGIFWSLDYQGNPLDTTKHSYNTAFAVYALASYYDASKDKEALNLAMELYHLIEEYYADEYGYREALTIDFQPESNEHLSENGVMAEKTMNTTLHIYEAYTELYRVTGLEELADKLKWILHIFKDNMYAPQKHRLEVFFDAEMNSILDLHSYGHDIETAWLLDLGMKQLGDDAVWEEMQGMITDLEQEILSVAYDGESLAAECEKGKVFTNRIWWVQCEAIIGFYNAYQKHPEQTAYKEAAEQIWHYTKENFVDGREGSCWYNERFYDKQVNREQPIVSPWKCPYHNSRMCFEMLKRLPEA